MEVNMTEEVKETTAQQENPILTEEEKKFSQAEVDDLISKRLARERKKYPTDEELADWRNWKETRQQGEEASAKAARELNDYKTKYDHAIRELEQARNEMYLLAKGVPGEDVDYYAYKISKLTNEETTFEQAAQKYLEEKHIGGMKVSTGVQVTGSAAKSENDVINDALRKMTGRK
jgi:hypothetical protein